MRKEPTIIKTIWCDLCGSKIDGISYHITVTVNDQATVRRLYNLEDTCYNCFSRFNHVFKALDTKVGNRTI